MYHVNEIFYSLQGEGARAGTANVFVRMAGCNLECDDAKEGEAFAVPDTPAGDLRVQSRTAGFKCDTDFSGGHKLTAGQILEAAQNVSSADCMRPAVIFTGGEPSLQVDEDLMDAFDGWYRAMETNGTVHVPPGWLDWLTVSPKTAEHTLRIGGGTVIAELKYVRHRGQALPRPRLNADLFYISPATQPDGTIHPGDMVWCVELCKQHPRWRLTTQQHKLWAIR